MKDIAIYGAGGLGREVAYLIELINQSQDAPQWRLVGFFDDGKTKGSDNGLGSVLGGMDDLNAWPTPLAVAMAIGSPGTLSALTSRITNPLIDFPNIIAPDVVSYGPIAPKLGRGNIICTRCMISCEASLGDFNILNGFVAVGHDAKIGDCNVAMPGAKLSGSITVGDHNLFGANSFVMQGTKVGNDVTLSPCSALLRKPKDGCLYIGNPATLVKI
ncbi:MAG: acetyltransferase [Bacteroidales bacterium]|nr:acetyltransferase [Bacteroidales bacterium]MCD8394968.1 acetyltransferase [Bacteroidales bacterium]